MVFISEHDLTGTGGIATVDTTGGNISLAGNLIGVGGLNKVGSNVLTLSGSNSYGGGTFVGGGKMVVDNSKALSDGSSLVIGDAGAFAPVIPSPGGQGAAPVPEPGSLALLCATLCGAATYRRRRSRWSCHKGES